MTDTRKVDRSRRRFLVTSGLTALAAAAGLAAGPLMPRAASAVESRARIVILGAGAAGLAIAARLARRLEGATITIVDPRERHIYQPGLTLVAAGHWSAEHVLDRNERYVPAGVNWLRQAVVSVDPDGRRVATTGGQTLRYDYLVVTTGLELDFEAIDGMHADLIGTQGIGCVYASPEHAERTWQAASAYIAGGGVGLFTRPAGDIKCAGAPLKVTMLTEDALRRAGTRSGAELTYLFPGASLFTQPQVDQFLRDYFPGERSIGLAANHVLSAIDPSRQQATFRTPEGPRTLDYDFIHVVPPMRAAGFLRASGLAWGAGPYAGWLEVDQHTLRHPRYPEVFGAGDVVGTPIGKTAASVKAQAPVVADNLLAAIQDAPLPSAWNGYTSCPLITEQGQAMLVEFDFNLEITPSFPFIDPFRPQWTPWALKDRLLHAAYNAMLHGRV